MPVIINILRTITFNKFKDNYYKKYVSDLVNFKDNIYILKFKNAVPIQNFRSPNICTTLRIKNIWNSWMENIFLPIQIFYK